MKKIILAGNAVTAEILYGYLSADPRYQIIALTVDDEFIEQGALREIDSIPLSHLGEVGNPPDCSIIMAMGYHDINRSRESMFLRLKKMGYQIETYIHPEAKVFTQIPLGEGSVVLPSAVIEPHVYLGANSVVWQM